jgi:hypothetical protein
VLQAPQVLQVLRVLQVEPTGAEWLGFVSISAA